MNPDETTAASKGDSMASVPGVDAHERWQRTAVTAFFLAESRGFAPGRELEDWLAAERIVDAALIAAAVAVDDLAATTPLAVEPPAVTRAKRPAKKKSAATSATTGIEAPPKKKAATARRASSRTVKSKPGIEADLGGMA